jgi:polyhydroxybutyrate depolymerase
MLAGLLGSCSSIKAKLIPQSAAQPRADAEGVLKVGSLNRVYDLHIPASYTSANPLPLLLAFHGKGGNGKEMEKMTGFSEIAEQAGFIVVYPDAIGQHWDARRGSQPETTHDVEFIAALIQELSKRYSIDRRRIYATGFSNGGMFSQRLACELADKITAVASVSAALPENLSHSCKPARPISVLLMNGTNDSVVPYAVAGKALLSVTDTVKYWQTSNRCDSNAARAYLPVNRQVELESYQNCAGATTLQLYTLNGSEHAWGFSQTASASNRGTTDQDFNASQIIWQFFSELT